MSRFSRMNHFAARTAAERYARWRPHFHPVVMDRVASFLSLSTKFPLAIDVGCGTGLSTVALKRLARRIVGVDPAAEMIALAEASPQIEYIVAPAEDLPFAESVVDLMTLSSVFHWVDRSAFLAEAKRVIRPQGWLIIYENSFSGRMQGNAQYLDWTHSTLLSKYPTPVRNRSEFLEGDAEKAGFEFVLSEHYENQVQFSVEALVGYLTTQSNVIAAVEGQGERIEDVIDWLSGNVRPMFGDSAYRSFAFQGYIWYLRRAGGQSRMRRNGDI